MNNIKRLREKRGLSVRDLGTKTNINYVSLSRMETGLQKIYDEPLIALADFFKVSTDYLLGREWNDPERTVIKTVDFEFSDVLHKLTEFTDKQLYKLSGAIDFIIENRENYNPQQIKNSIDKVVGDDN